MTLVALGPLSAVRSPDRLARLAAAFPAGPIVEAACPVHLRRVAADGLAMSAQTQERTGKALAIDR